MSQECRTEETDHGFCGTKAHNIFCPAPELQAW